MARLDRADASEILDLVHDAIIVRDLSGRIIQWNLAAEHCYGWPRGEAIGRKFGALLHGAEARSLEAAELELLETGRWQGEVERRGREGQAVSVEARWSLGRDAEGRPLHIVETSRDIAERRRTQAEAQLTEYRYRNLFQAMAVAFWEIDFTGVGDMLRTAFAAGVTDLRAHMLGNRALIREAMARSRVRDVNAKAVALFGAQSSEELVGGSVERFWPVESEPVFVEAVVASAEKRPHYLTETRLLTVGGDLIDVLFTVSWSPESRKEGVILLGVIDISERKRAEEALGRLQADLARAARISMLGEFTASIAHEVNQPLAAIATNVEAGLRWLNRPEPDIEEVRALSGRVIADARRAAEIIGRVRAMAEQRAPERTVLDVNALVEEVLLFLRHDLRAQAIAVSLDLAPRLPSIAGDGTQIQQILVNLAVNAVQAMAELPVERRSLGIRTAVAGDAVRISIEDQGPGFAEGTEQRLFDSFFTTKASGMGMGLRICRSIAEAHGGTIDAVRRSDGPGATFVVTLPAATDPRGAIPIPTYDGASRM
ncbi:PAS domain S-box protein [Sphingosinicella sp. BN140058]|uniref:PAS domain-containing sensor histidine kinase n=1 Tax=Sphingosinicella sp. BN140058 TaxID=1892855 RepID=UPI0010113A02|nr:PAS domain S-box protein [Sphingosinicella sp. BN140058]QAY78709.1 PAS domain S-box protein [Sphingosinicella sp. BN140058]